MRREKGKLPPDEVKRLKAILRRIKKEMPKRYKNTSGEKRENRGTTFKDD